METENKRIVEINGMKIEVDLRTAKKVDEFRVGSGVKILTKSYSGYESHFGMIVGFDQFKNLPTIIVAYLSPKSWENPLNFVYINSETKDTEICLHDPNDLGVAKVDVLASFDREVAKKEQELREIARKRDYFVRMFGQFFESQEASAG